MRLMPLLLMIPLLVLANSATAAVKLGIDVLAEKQFDILRDKRVALVTNHTGLTSDGTHLVDLLMKNRINLVKLFSPEHGLYGLKDEQVGDGVDEKTGLPVFSLYGKNRQPTGEMLAGVDVLVFDIQDVGTRFYTYISTMGLCMEACAANGVAFVVLDRPNPIGGLRVDGPINDARHSGFTAYRRLPLVHGMTVGELARLFNAEFGIGARLTIVPMTGWQRSMYWDDTGVKWVNPSPNMRSPTQAILYPAIGMLELSNLSVGRGTETPFELIGAPYIDADQFAAALTTLRLPGVKFEPVASFTPLNTPHAFNKTECHGVRITLIDRDAFEPTLTGLSIAWTLKRLYPDWQSQKANLLLKNDAVIEALFGLDNPKEAKRLYAQPLEAWMPTRAKYIIYP